MDSSILQKIGHYCAYQERTHNEVRYKLVELGSRGEELEEIILYLIEHNYLNEERYAQQYARGKHYLKKWGRNKITYELKKKDISNYCIQQGLKEIEQSDYFNTASKLIQQKLKDIKSLNPFDVRKKIYNYMMQKGYESNIINEILNDILV